MKKKQYFFPLVFIKSSIKCHRQCPQKNTTHRGYDGRFRNVKFADDKHEIEKIRNSQAVISQLNKAKASAAEKRSP